MILDFMSLKAFKRVVYICELLARCWNADPRARPTASEVSAALAELLVHEKHRAFLHGLG